VFEIGRGCVDSVGALSFFLVRTTNCNLCGELESKCLSVSDLSRSIFVDR
jgi:hypothetical protein